MSATAALIISGIISAAGAITSSALQNRAQRKARGEAKGLALIARGDEIRKQTKEFGLAEERIGLERESVGLAKTKTNFEMAQSRRVENATHLGNLSSALTIASQKDQNMTNFILSLYGKTGAK